MKVVGQPASTLGYAVVLLMVSIPEDDTSKRGPIRLRSRRIGLSRHVPTHKTEPPERPRKPERVLHEQWIPIAETPHHAYRQVRPGWAVAEVQSWGDVHCRGDDILVEHVVAEAVTLPPVCAHCSRPAFGLMTWIPNSLPDLTGLRLPPMCRRCQRQLVDIGVIPIRRDLDQVRDDLGIPVEWAEPSVRDLLIPPWKERR